MQKALAIIKKNLLSIICGLVAVLAMVSLAYPLAGMRTKFKAELDDRAKNYTRAQSLLREERFLPVVTPGAAPEPLTMFPTAQIITAGQAARDTVHDQSDQLLLKAIALNQEGHDPLYAPDILPNPGDHVFDYRSAYLDQVQKQLPIKLHGVMPPNADEINRKIDQVHQTEVEDKIIKIGIPPVEVNRAQLENSFLDLKAKLPDQLRRQSSMENKLYIDPSALSINGIMTNVDAKPTPSDVWYAQLSLWVEQDVCDSIIAANNAVPTSNIQTDAIKRLVQLKVPGDVNIYVQSGGAVPDDASGGDLRDYSRSPTGHVCNDLYDVVQYFLVVEADQRQIPLILRELQRGKLTTVLGIEIVPIDYGAADAQGFMYGTAPVVQLSISLESLFMRKWTLPLMPDEVKAELKIPPPAPPAQ